MFAHRYIDCNPDQVKNFKNPETVLLLAFAIIMLNTDLHNASIKPERKMKQEDFVKNLRGMATDTNVQVFRFIGSISYIVTANACVTAQVRVNLENSLPVL